MRGKVLFAHLRGTQKEKFPRWGLLERSTLLSELISSLLTISECMSIRWHVGLWGAQWLCVRGKMGPQVFNEGNGLGETPVNDALMITIRVVSYALGDMFS